MFMDSMGRSQLLMDNLNHLIRLTLFIGNPTSVNHSDVNRNLNGIILLIIIFTYLYLLICIMIIFSNNHSATSV